MNGPSCLIPITSRDVKSAQNLRTSQLCEDEKERAGGMEEKMQSTEPPGLLLDHLANTLINTVFLSSPVFTNPHARTHTNIVWHFTAALLKSKLYPYPLVSISSALWLLHYNISSNATALVSFEPPPSSSLPSSPSTRHWKTQTRSWSSSMFDAFLNSSGLFASFRPTQRSHLL